VPLIAVTMAAGLLLVGVADAGGWHRAGWAVPLFYPSLALVSAAPTFRLLAGGARRGERVTLVLLLALALYLVKVMHEPTMFTFHDELGHWRTTSDILTSKHLFGANPIVGAYAYYPGIELVTAALVSLTGLSIFHAALVVVGAARLVLAGSVFWFMEDVLGSAWLAGIAALGYMANPNFLFFDAQFAYESLAIPLAAAAFWLIARAARARGRAVWAPAVLGGLVAVAVVPTHHMTSYAVVVFFGAWAAASIVAMRGEDGTLGRKLAAGAVLLLVLVVDWNRGVAGAATYQELGAIPGKVISGLHALTLGNPGGKHLFQASAGQAAEPRWGQALGFASVALVLLALPVGLWALRKLARRSPLVLVLCVAAIAYPVSLVPRLTQSGTETSDRAAEFLFFGVAAVAAAGQQYLRTSSHRAGPLRSLLIRTPITLAMTVVFVGGFIVSWAPWSRLPGPFIPAAGEQSISQQGVAAATWARRHLPANSRLATDETDAVLMGSYGGLAPQQGVIDGLPVPTLFFARSFDSDSRRIIAADELRYIVVDNRLSGVRPLRGFYFESDEPGAYAHFRPLPLSALRKFDRPPLGRIYDNGSITIYDAHGLVDEGAGR
jgi:hypothetical protein